MGSAGRRGPCRGAAKEPPGVTRRLARSGAGRRGIIDEPHPRRFPSRPGPGRKRRRLHHRLRGRAGSPARGTAGQVEPAARRCRHPALVRLCRCDDHRPQERRLGPGIG